MTTKSKYAQKVQTGNQMYGNGTSHSGCCANKRPANHMQERVNTLRKAQGLTAL